MSKIIPPEFLLSRFSCPWCGAFAHHDWYRYVYGYSGPLVSSQRTELDETSVSQCASCDEFTLWKKQAIIYPVKSIVPAPNEDMPENVRRAYQEAASVFDRSPRAAAAFLRLALQELCISLGEKGDKINDDIASLVSKGLPVKLQQAMDVLRVVGNNAVHPGKIDFDDDAKTSMDLFQLLNIIVDTMISQPQAIEALYQTLPPGNLQSIEKRDKK